jgi:hypothetical protein
MYDVERLRSTRPDACARDRTTAARAVHTPSRERGGNQTSAEAPESAVAPRGFGEHVDPDSSTIVVVNPSNQEVDNRDVHFWPMAIRSRSPCHCSWQEPTVSSGALAPPTMATSPLAPPSSISRMLTARCRHIPAHSSPGTPGGAGVASINRLNAPTLLAARARWVALRLQDVTRVLTGQGRSGGGSPSWSAACWWTASASAPCSGAAEGCSSSRGSSGSRSSSTPISGRLMLALRIMLTTHPTRRRAPNFC